MFSQILEEMIIIPGGTSISAVGMASPPGNPHRSPRLIPFLKDTGYFQACSVSCHIIHSSGKPSIIMAGNQYKLFRLPLDQGNGYFHFLNGCFNTSGKKDLMRCLFRILNQTVPIWKVHTKDRDLQQQKGRIKIRCTPYGAYGIFMDFCLRRIPYLDPCQGSRFFQLFGIAFIKTMAEDDFPLHPCKPFGYLQRGQLLFPVRIIIDQFSFQASRQIQGKRTGP